MMSSSMRQADMDKPLKKIKSPYWRQTRRLTTLLLFFWAALSFGVLFFARELSSVTFFGWPFSFYMAAQGLTLSYVFILGIYSLCMHYIRHDDTKRKE
ncbi:DUF4212 domain-containing protein [Undibacterium sp. SXout7W]|uniref:DUF4212 domain-containing protein n=1 Tax=Undibacterium sp. SXout7W TaxID=3413049 RepID=UPI003BF212BD